MALISKTSAVLAILVIAVFSDFFVHGRCYIHTPGNGDYFDSPSMGCVMRDKNETTGCPGGLRRYDSDAILICDYPNKAWICCQIAQVIEEKQPSQNNARNVAANKAWKDLKEMLNTLLHNREL